MDFLKELKDRFFSDKPKFWNKVQIFGGAIGVVGGLIAYFPISLPAGIVAWGAYLLTSGTSIATLAQFAIKDKSENNSNKQNPLKVKLKEFAKNKGLLCKKVKNEAKKIRQTNPRINNLIQNDYH